MKNWLLVLLTVIVTGGLVGGGTYYYLNQKSDKDTAALQAQIDTLNTEKEALATTAAATATTAETATTAPANTYTNTDYGFSFVYPEGWTTAENPYITASTGVVSSINYRNPADTLANKKIDCVQNEAVSWANPAPTKAECQSILADLTTKQKTDLDNTKPGSEYHTLFVRVYNASGYTDAKKWLTNHYTSLGGQIADSYNMGKEISLGSQTGVYSDASCCAGYDVSYAVLKGAYVYEFGTNDRTADADEKDNTFLQKMATTFQFTTPTSSVTSADVFSLANLKATSVTISGTSYKLANGTYTHPGTGPFENGVPETIILDESHIAVDSANADQVAIILQIHARLGGGNATFNELEIMNNVSGTPTYVARVALNNNEQSTINNVTFASDIVTVHMTVSGVAVTASYKLSGTTLIKQ